MNKKKNIAKNFQREERFHSCTEEFTTLKTGLKQHFSISPLHQKDRFLTRIHKNKENLIEFTNAIETDPKISEEIKLSILSYIQKKPKADWSICIQSPEITDILPDGQLDDDDLSAVETEFERIGAEIASYFWNNEDFMYAGGGQPWTYQYAKFLEDPLLYHCFFLFNLKIYSDIGVYGNEVGILTADPYIGNKFLNYAVAPKEVCDFFNRCFFPRYIAMFIGGDREGVLVLVKSKKLPQFLENLKRLLRKS